MANGRLQGGIPTSQRNRGWMEIGRPRTAVPRKGIPGAARLRGSSEWEPAMALQHVSLVPLWGTPSVWLRPFPVVPSANESVSGDPGRGLSLKAHGSPPPGPSAFPAPVASKCSLTSPSTSANISPRRQSLRGCIVKRDIRCGSGECFFKSFGFEFSPSLCVLSFILLSEPLSHSFAWSRID
jgi:hypothetical protein